MVCKSSEGCQNAITSMLENLRSLGYITFLDLCGERLQLTDMGWNYGELSRREGWRLFAQSFVAPLLVSIVGTLLTQWLIAR